MAFCLGLAWTFYHKQIWNVAQYTYFMVKTLNMEGYISIYTI